MRIRFAIAGLAALAALGFAAPADAATVSADSFGAVMFRAAAGEANDVRAAQAGNDVTVRDNGAPLTPGTGCTAAGPNQVRCPGAHFIMADLGDANDSFDVAGDLRANVSGGPGDDRITTGGGNDVITGSEGNDVLDAGGGNDIVGGGGTGDPGSDTLNGGAGNDVLYPGPGTDDVRGGAGEDTVNYSGETLPVTVTLDGQANDGSAGEGDRVANDVEDIVGGRGNDTLVGSAGPNVIDGGPGSDHIIGGDGADTLVDTSVGAGDVFDGGAGDDGITSRDVKFAEDFHQLIARRDQVACGAGADSVLGDFQDVVAADCESVDRSIRVRQTRVRMTSKGRVSIQVMCKSLQPCSFGLILRKRPQFTRLTASRSATIPAGKTADVTLRMSHRGAAYVRHHHRVKAQMILFADPGLIQTMTVLAPR